LSWKYLTICSHAYPEEGEEEAVREGFDPTDNPEPENTEAVHNLDYPFTTEEGEQSKDQKPPVNKEAERWEQRDHSNAPDPEERQTSPQYGSFRDERNAWNDS
jgi:hypothetical protein